MNESSSNPLSKPNWPLLAGMRWMLALCVMFLHVFLIEMSHPLAVIGYKFNGFAAVVGFLMISGFSISHSIHSQPKGFLMRRVRRIYPVFLAALVLAALPYVLFKVVSIQTVTVGMPSKRQFLASLLMLQNTVAPPLPTFGPSWSLAVECFFYLCAPLLLKLGKRWIAVICAVSALCFAIQPHVHLPGGQLWYADMVGMRPALYLAWPWLLGWILERNQNSILVKSLVFFVPALFALNPYQGGNWYVFLLAATGVALVYGPRIRLSEKVQKVALYLGDVSYPLYLVHMPVFYLLYNATKTTVVWPYVTASIIASLAVLHLVDKPLRARGKLKVTSQKVSHQA